MNKFLILLSLAFWLVGCGTSTDSKATGTPVSALVMLPTTPATLPPPATATAIPTATATATHTPTATPTATATATQTPTATPTATPVGPCSQRVPADSLLTLVTLTYSLSRDYAPQDLVLLTDHLPVEVTLGYPTELRQVALEPLQQMMQAMLDEGLQPRILSGYRSFSAQSIAWAKWNREEPERAHILSAPPGHSEHQLGTTLDFGSSELADIVGIPDIQFHTYFYQTSEGDWLLRNAHNYGFTLSYPLEAFELTGFYYEPWHYRYVGVELATELYETEQSLTAYLLEREPEPCIP